MNLWFETDLRGSLPPTSAVPLKGTPRRDSRTTTSSTSPLNDAPLQASSRRDSTLRTPLLRLHLPAQMATAGSSRDLEQLPLLPYLSASPSPTVLFPAAPLLEALAARTFAFAPHRSPTNSSQAEVLAMPGVGSWSSRGKEASGGSWRAQREEERQSALVVGSLLAALQPEWTNDAWRELQRGWRKESVQGKGKGSAREGMEGADTEMRDASAGGSGVDSRAQLAFLSREKQGILLSLLLDTLQAAEKASTAHQPPSWPPPVQLNRLSLSATLLPSHLVLVGTAIPQQPSSTSIYPIRYTPPPLVLTKQPFFASTTSRAANLSLLPLPPLPSPTLDPYLEFLGTTNMGRMIRKYPWHTSSSRPLAAPYLEELTPFSRFYRSYRAVGPRTQDDGLLYARQSVPRSDSVWRRPRNHLVEPAFAPLLSRFAADAWASNDPYIGAAGQKHPDLLGKPMREGWGDLWEELGPVAESVMQGERFASFRRR